MFWQSEHVLKQIGFQIKTLLYKLLVILHKLLVSYCTQYKQKVMRERKWLYLFQEGKYGPKFFLYYLFVFVLFVTADPNLFLVFVIFLSNDMKLFFVKVTCNNPTHQIMKKKLVLYR